MTAKDGKNGKQIFHAIARYNCDETKDMIKRFIEEFKCDPVVLDEKGKTPMMVAIRQGNLKFVQVLHEVYKIPLDCMSNDGRGLVHYALRV